MKKYKKFYYFFLHLNLLNEHLSYDEFKVITKLTDQEISSWFSLSRRRVFIIVQNISLIVKYQKAKLDGQMDDWLDYRTQMSQRNYLWSETTVIMHIPEGLSSEQLGLALVSLANPRLAITCALRLGISLPNESIVLKNSDNIQSLIYPFFHLNK